MFAKLTIGFNKASPPQGQGLAASDLLGPAALKHAFQTTNERTPGLHSQKEYFLCPCLNSFP